jgi:hypothetical protein
LAAWDTAFTSFVIAPATTRSTSVRTTTSTRFTIITLRSCGWRIPAHAAIGVWCSPGQWFSQHNVSTSRLWISDFRSVFVPSALNEFDVRYSRL